MDFGAIIDMETFYESLKLITDFETATRVRAIHNELRILRVLLESGPLPSLRIMAATGRSISGHNADMKRLLTLGHIELLPDPVDRRQKIYGLSRKMRDFIESFDSRATDPVSGPASPAPAWKAVERGDAPFMLSR